MSTARTTKTTKAAKPVATPAATTPAPTPAAVTAATVTPAGNEIVGYKIHPGLGIARIGNSPTEFYVGPLTPGEVPDPDGGFKDKQGRIKRQAAFPALRCVPRTDGSVLRFIRCTTGQTGKKRAQNNQQKKSRGAVHFTWPPDAPD